MTKTKETKTKRFNFWPYFKKYKWLIMLWMVMMLVDIAIQTFYGIFGAHILADVSSSLYLLAIKKLLIIL